MRAHHEARVKTQNHIACLINQIANRDVSALLLGLTVNDLDLPAGALWAPRVACCNDLANGRVIEFLIQGAELLHQVITAIRMGHPEANILTDLGV